MQLLYGGLCMMTFIKEGLLSKDRIKIYCDTGRSALGVPYVFPKGERQKRGEVLPDHAVSRDYGASGI